MLDKLFVTAFQLHRLARSSTVVFVDLLLACYLANATCAIMDVVAALIFIILIVSRSHAFCLVVPVRSSLHALVVVAVISYFQHNRPWALLEPAAEVPHIDVSEVPRQELTSCSTLNKRPHLPENNVVWQKRLDFLLCGCLLRFGMLASCRHGPQQIIGRKVFRD